MILCKKLIYYMTPLVFIIINQSILAETKLNTQKKETKEKIEQIKIGNFALKASQQPGPLVSFGQNMVDKGDVQIFSFIDDFAGCNKRLITVVPTMLYGLQNNFSLYIQIPVAAKYKEDNLTFHGLQDILMQLEYAFYDHIREATTNQISIVVNATLPTGDSSFQSFHPKTFSNYGSPTFFIGFTADHFSPTWYSFISAGARIPTKNENVTIGKQFLYQCGISHNITALADAYIFNWLIEFDGTYKQKNKNFGITDPNSGGNQILLGPSLWLSTPHFSLQAGISAVIYQYLYGKQNKDTYFLSIEAGYKF